MSLDQLSGIFPMIITFFGMFVIFYFLLLRPQQKQKKNHEMLISSLKKNNYVLLSSGITGQVDSVGDKFIILKISEKTKIKVLKVAVSSLLKSE